MELLELYYDVLIKIIEEVEPEDLAALAQTSIGFNHFVKGNEMLYKAHYLKNFDDPRRRPTDPAPDWIAELQRLVKLRKILQSQSPDVKSANMDFVLETISTLIKTGTESEGLSLNCGELTKLFSNPQNADMFMHRSSLYRRAGMETQSQAQSLETRQQSARLHSIYGIPKDSTGRRTLSTHPFARSRVYDLRNYSKRSRWGPFRNDGSMRVDWELVESIMVVLGYNNGICSRRYMDRFVLPWSAPFANIFQDRFAHLPFTDLQPPLPSLTKEPSLPLDFQDPYNVSGIWARIVCFLDYDDLYDFNFNTTAVRTPEDQPLPPITMEEAVRHIMMHLEVTAVTAPGKNDNQTMPVIHFDGKARAVDTNMDANANSSIRGCVRMTPEGEVRWSTVWIFNGHEERWRSEAIQVGGLRSKRGVVGVWYDKSFDPHGPAGPTAFWKVKELASGTDEDGNDSDDFMEL
ncbi:uncharacterized protein CC84DRAFT_1190723 [Paraphaeosphaeria sporulosa]|uniref:F-box domain-containing protein n=1 Tax=Paraphaeosphaeria sporulosa TaxID=1460663 RepID=A0A177BWW2_9PLEO|nr:uncharacterized protein CC84DRAFT_1190723 [Paraphaeosphaeria sporulosa]OAF99892.1 hypothetical protein CC84DRAFT_1190723 [Paraphaeosphaeria sporulosa]